MDLYVKRIYSPRAPEDGVRVLVDRIWPRGFSRDTEAIDTWMKDLAPSNELRHWFGHDPARWPEFRRRYADELASNGPAMAQLLALVDKGPVTLVYSARDEIHNQAVALREILLEGL
ncbi:MAG: DUF488 domain-containing protein [Rhodothermales bacterium]